MNFQLHTRKKITIPILISLHVAVAVCSIVPFVASYNSTSACMRG